MELCICSFPRSCEVELVASMLLVVGIAGCTIECFLRELEESCQHIMNML